VHAESDVTQGIVRKTIDVGRFPWVRPLVDAYANNFPSVSSLFAGDSADPAAWRATIAGVQRATHDRASLVRLLERQLSERGAPEPARRAAVRLADPKSVAIVTGQQAGVFGGPLYTLLKAITTLQLSRQVERDHDTPAVAVFWVEAEDHDWQEVRTAQVLDQDLAARTVEVADLAGAGTNPVATLRFDDQIEDAINALESALAPTEFTSDVMARLRVHYRAGAGVAAAFASWLDELLGPHGLVVYDASDPHAKPLAAGLFVGELRNPRTAALAREAGQAMAKLGHAPQVDPALDGVGLFYMDGGGRRAIKRAGADYLIGQIKRPAADLVAEAEYHPERFSPGVLFRPLVQDVVFPTVCYVGGPSELAYQAQLGGVYRAFHVEPPLLHPRASATLLDAASVRFLDKYGIALEALHGSDDLSLNQLLASQFPPELEEELAATERDLTAHAAALKAAVTAIDATLAGAVDTTLVRMRDSVKGLHNKIVQASKRKDETLRRQFTHARALAFPGGAPQERALNVMFFLNRYGPALCDRLLESLPMDPGKHYVLVP
jgi:bacillithiol biosynthesis cysteine-adding enzyme BshC